jgi:hypothetical protein
MHSAMSVGSVGRMTGNAREIVTKTSSAVMPRRHGRSACSYIPHFTWIRRLCHRIADIADKLSKSDSTKARCNCAAEAAAGDLMQETDALSGELERYHPGLSLWLHQAARTLKHDLKLLCNPCLWPANQTLITPLTSLRVCLPKRMTNLYFDARFKYHTNLDM